MSSPEDTLDLVESPKLAPVSAGVDVIVPTDKAEAEAKAREKGWVRVTPYEYSRYDNEAPKDPTDRSWLCQAAVYEWNDEYGEVGPPNPELEKELYFSEYKNRAGDLAMYGTFLVKHRGPYQVEHINSFEGAGLHPVMLENVKLCGYERPTPVQAHTIPAVLMGHDVIASAQTGSGKTAAYLIPILSRLMGKAKALAAPRPTGPSFDPATDRVRAEPLVLIICPSRELAAQIFDEARRLCYRTMLRPCVAYGGASPKAQREELERGCDILIGTPGRLVDFVTKPHLLSLNRVKYTVIDEADELLQYDWEDEMSKLLSGGDTGQDTDHLYMMFSATFTAAARKLAREYMSAQHMRFEIGRAGSTHTNVKQVVIYVDPAYKLQAVWDLLMSDQEPGRTIIFVNSKRTADMLDDYLYNLHLPTTSIHADRTQREREDSLRAFRIGSAPILVATGVTARGIDVKHVKHVINYDLPSASYGGIQEYVHRIGRTARIGNPGLATSFYSEHNEDIAPDLVKILMENNQVVPECLQGFAPSDGELVWDEENSDPEDDPEEDGGAPLSGYGTGSVNGDATSKSDEPATFTAIESVGGDAW